MSHDIRNLELRLKLSVEAAVTYVGPGDLSFRFDSPIQTSKQITLTIIISTFFGSLHQREISKTTEIPRAH